MISLHLFTSFLSLGVCFGNFWIRLALWANLIQKFPHKHLDSEKKWTRAGKTFVHWDFSFTHSNWEGKYYSLFRDDGTSGASRCMKWLTLNISEWSWQTRCLTRIYCLLQNDFPNLGCVVVYTRQKINHECIVQYISCRCYALGFTFTFSHEKLCVELVSNQCHTTFECNLSEYDEVVSILHNLIFQL